MGKTPEFFSYFNYLSEADLDQKKRRTNKKKRIQLKKPKEHP